VNCQAGDHELVPNAFFARTRQKYVVDGEREAAGYVESVRDESSTTGDPKIESVAI
jgi:hypothetical protein